MSADFPAAHSMDTEWFAVDQCGHVAIFSSGEEGCVPENAPDAYDYLDAEWPFPGELDKALQENRVRHGVHGTRIDHLGERTVKERLLLRDDKRVFFAEGFYLLGPGLKADRSRLRVAVNRPGLTFPLGELVFGTTDGLDWVSGRVCQESWEWLHEVPHRCAGCIDGLHIDTRKRPEAFRIVRYECNEYGSKPYQKTHSPYPPTTLDELARLIGQPAPKTLSFPQFCFRDKRVLQPMQWLPSRMWVREEWIDEEGAKHRNPRRPAE